MNAFAGALAARGVGTETVIGLLCPNVPAFATVFHGILRVGAIVTTINSLYTAGEIEKQLRDAGATWLITVSPLLPQAKAAAAEAVGISDDHLIVLDGADGHPNLRELLTEQAARARGELRPRDPHRRAPVLVGDDGHSQGRDAHAPQPRRERAAVPREHRPAGHRSRARGAAVLPHLRNDRAAQPRAAPAGEPRDDAEVRSGRVPHEHPELRLHLPVHRPADRRRAREASDRRPVRHLDGAHRVLGRRAPGRRDRRGSRAAASTPA